MLRRVILMLLLLCTPAQAESLLVIGWDGAGLNNVGPMLKEGRLPNLQRLIDSGAKLCPVEIHLRTNTAPNWTQLWTGLNYDQTGVLGIRSYQKYIVNHADPLKALTYDDEHQSFEGLNFWVQSVPWEHTILSRLKDSGFRIGWFTSKPGLLGADPAKGPLSEIARHADDFLTVEPDVGRPAEYLEKLTSRAKQFMAGDNHGGYVAFIHFNPDEFGHKWGENGQKYLNHIELCDAYLGELLESKGDARVIVITDHGFDESQYCHKNAGDGWMVTDLPVHRAYRQHAGQRAYATMRDMAPTILDSFGIDWKALKPQMRGKSLLGGAN